MSVHAILIAYLVSFVKVEKSQKVTFLPSILPKNERFKSHREWPHVPMSGSSQIRSILIGIQYRKCFQTLDIYLPFASLF